MEFRPTAEKERRGVSLANKLPAFQFYPGDWLKDPNLRRCSKAAKGVWIDMMCLMFECEDRGILASGGVPWTKEEISAAIGGDHAENLACIEELLRKGVVSLTKLGAISNRRMVRDEEMRANHRARQHKYRKSLQINKNGDADVTHDVTRVSHPSSSSSSLSTKSSGISESSDLAESRGCITFCAEPKQVRSAPEASVPTRHLPTSGSSETRTKRRQAKAEALPPGELAGTLPLNDGSLFPISKSQIAEWGELYPAVDVMQECREMKGWLSAHPSRRKTRRGILKFVHSWLSREQDKVHVSWDKGRSLPYAPAQRSSGANQRVSANQEAIRRAVERRGIFDFGPTDNADHEGVSASGTRGIAGDFSAGIRDSGGASWLAAREGSDADDAGHAGPEILSPSIRTRRGA